MHNSFNNGSKPNRQLRSLYCMQEPGINTPFNCQQYNIVVPAIKTEKASLFDSMETQRTMSVPFAVSQHEQLNQNAAEENSKFIEQMLLDYAFSNEKGQRIYGPPKDWTDEPPEHGCEVFIGHIPRDCLEHELISVFSKIGKIYQFRLMMESPNSNRGFGFCCYTNKEDTKRAMEELNNFEIRPGKTIGVQLSVDNCKLFVGGIPTNKKRDDILEEMKKVTECVKDVIVYPSIEDKNKNRGFAFVEYNSHRAATIARQKLQKQPFKLWNKICHVDWAEPEPQVSDEIMAKVTNLHARNLLDDTTEDEIRRIFIEASGGDQSNVVKVRKLKDCAFIHFKDRDSADRARTKLNNTCFDGGVEIEVNWAKPDQKKLSQDGKVPSTRLPQFTKLLSPELLQYDYSSLLAQYPAAMATPTQPHFLAQTLLGYPGLQNLSSQDWQCKNFRRNAVGAKTLITSQHRKHPIECLDNYCVSMGLERPQYQTSHAQIQDPETGATITRYYAEVTLPGTSISYATPTLYANVDDAMTACAQTVLTTFMASVTPFVQDGSENFEDRKQQYSGYVPCQTQTPNEGGERPTGSYDQQFNNAPMAQIAPSAPMFNNNSAASDPIVLSHQFYNILGYGYLGQNAGAYLLNPISMQPLQTPLLGSNANLIGQQFAQPIPSLDDSAATHNLFAQSLQPTNSQPICFGLGKTGPGHQQPQATHSQYPTSSATAAALLSSTATYNNLNGSLNALIQQQHQSQAANLASNAGNAIQIPTGLYNSTAAFGGASDGALDLSSLVRSGTPLQQQFLQAQTPGQFQLEQHQQQNIFSQMDASKMPQMSPPSAFVNGAAQKNILSGGNPMITSTCSVEPTSCSN